MHLFQLARNPPQWLRVALVSLMLAFALNSIAHVTHRHDATIGHQLHSAPCGYCISFDHMTPAPASRALAIVPLFAAESPSRAPTLVAARFSLTAAQPRAPPGSFRSA
jgi:hypothetical protein